MLQALEQRFPCTPWERPQWKCYSSAADGQAMLEQVYHEGTMAHEQPILEQFVMDCIPWGGPRGGPTLAQGKSVNRKEWQRGTVMY